ncbi:hypothetical protein AQV86_04095 [Nanohaloarchaea archaeon SG9]|nr:hypothetical protein AQV86_04095 [Nanohaloarchaea archaeon SG9]
MVFGLMASDGGGILTQIYQIAMILSFLIFPALIIFGPRLMIWQVTKKLDSALLDLEAFHNDTKAMFLDKLNPDADEAFNEKFRSMKNFQISEPTGLDPAGMVGRLENVLDASEDKFKRFVRRNADTEDEEKLANLNMAFKGVMGTQQIFKVMRHFKELVTKTGNFQLIGITQMMIPIYTELAEAQKGATRAFTDEAPIGDAIGPLVAAKLIEQEPEEVADDIIHSEEQINDQTVHVLKSRGPGARLGKYGNAIDDLADENDLEAIITVDAASKFEGEETGTVNEGVGVMMGGPGVEKSKIEEAAVNQDVPLEGVVIKQSAPEASKPMKKEIYEAYKPAVEKVKEIAEKFDGEVAVIGVGNTCGVKNRKEEVSTVHNRLQKYWKEYEEEDEDDVSHMGLMSAMPGGESSKLEQMAKTFMWNLPR